MQHNSKSIFTAVFISLFVFGLTGCSNPDSKYVKVEGAITYNGQTVEGATVINASGEPGGESASGTTDASGKYTLTSSGATNTFTGVLPGEYTVSVSKTLSTVTPDPDEEAEKKGDITYDELQKRLSAKGGSTAKAEHKDLLPKQYAQSSKTPLKATIEKGKVSTQNFELAD